MVCLIYLASHSGSHYDHILFAISGRSVQYEKCGNTIGLIQGLSPIIDPFYDLRDQLLAGFPLLWNIG